MRLKEEANHKIEEGLTMIYMRNSINQIDFWDAHNGNKM
jgi:hypothetical protein